MGILYSRRDAAEEFPSPILHCRRSTNHAWCSSHRAPNDSTFQTRS